jgi:6,7-dimethyl-8-ribityllumazine synthase
MAGAKDNTRAVDSIVRGAHLLIVEARYYDALLDALLEGAQAAIARSGATCEVITVPGALEVPPAIALAADSGRFDGFVALGCVIRGETTHYEIVSGESARAIMDLATQRGLAIGNGILTVETEAQAWARARISEQDKGGGAADAALHLIALKRRFALKEGA